MDSIDDAAAAQVGGRGNKGRRMRHPSSRALRSFRRGDDVALATGLVLTLLVVGWLIWASTTNIMRDREITASEIVSGG